MRLPWLHPTDPSAFFPLQSSSAVSLARHLSNTVAMIVHRSLGYSGQAQISHTTSAERSFAPEIVSYASNQNRIGEDPRLYPAECKKLKNRSIPAQLRQPPDDRCCRE